MATLTVDMNALPYLLEYNCVAGDTLPILIQFKLNGTAKDLTSATLALAGTKPDGTALTPRAVTPSDAVNGCFDGGLTSAETGAMTQGTCRHEVECTFGAGDTDLPSGVKTLLRVTTVITADTA